MTHGLTLSDGSLKLSSRSDVDEIIKPIASTSHDYAVAIRVHCDLILASRHRYPRSCRYGRTASFYRGSILVRRKLYFLEERTNGANNVC
jgi:hypothetical protein